VRQAHLSELHKVASSLARRASHLDVLQALQYV
jgi:hypothetical protein